MGRARAFSASYELDLWGRNAAGVRAAESSLRATRYDLETVRLTLVTGVASAYFQVPVAARPPRDPARENLVDRRSACSQWWTRACAMALRPRSTSRASRRRCCALRAAIPPLELQERQTLYALAILLGRPPEGFDAAGDRAVAAHLTAAARGARTSRGSACAPARPRQRRGATRCRQCQRRRGACRAAARNPAHGIGGTREQRADQFSERAHRGTGARRVRWRRRSSTAAACAARSMWRHRASAS